MAKQLIISVMEDVVGEYVLNISKENLKIAALRGKVKLENVQLDGDLIGSHVLGAVGLSGFAVLSCWAKTVKIVVPLRNIEKEPTRFEIRGVHLLCVPLLPSTANRQYGNGTPVDPRCTLRTRVKRSALARFERNFFGGRIPGEGPVSRRVRIAMKDAERSLKRSRRRSRSTYGEELDESDSESEEKSSKVSSLADSLANPPPNWKTKLREKVLRNIEASLFNLHVRCETCEGGLDFCPPTVRDKKTLPAYQRAFAFGWTLDSLIVRSANSAWEPSASDADNDDSTVASGGSSRRSGVSSLSSDQSGKWAMTKIAQINNACIYWDDSPPVLISESTLLRSRNHHLSHVKVQANVRAAMDALVTHQDPGDFIRLKLMQPGPSSPVRKSHEKRPSRPHQYCLESFNAELNLKLGDRAQPGPMHLFAEILSLDVNLTLHPHQFVQYQKLKSAMLSQQRYDTMLRQRPKTEPKKDPGLWWKYSIACVMSRPNSRPWEDVVRIAKNRKRYIDLVVKKLLNAGGGCGFHGGLNEAESRALLAIEDMLPIEALTSFHLLAMRMVHEKRSEDEEKAHSKNNGSEDRKRTRGINPLRKLLGGRKRSESADIEVGPEDEHLLLDDPETMMRSYVFDAIKERFGRKQWHNTFQLNDSKFRVSLMSQNRAVACLEVRTCGMVKTYGKEKREFLFNVIQAQLSDPLNTVPSFHLYRGSTLGKILVFEEVHWVEPLALGDQGLHWLDETLSSTNPRETVCRISASKDPQSLKLGVSAHPATLVWNKPSITAIANFFASPAAELKTEVTKQLRTVATPLARKAQLALLSPTAISVELNVAAPKIWFPVSSTMSDGAVLFDSGKMLMTFRKEEQITDTRWEFAARDIQVKFVREEQSDKYDVGEQHVMSIIKPLHIDASALFADKTESSTPELSSGPIRKVDISVSGVSLNLVNAEVLARAIGKWYAYGLVRVQKITEKSVKESKVEAPTLAKPSSSKAESLAAVRSQTLAEKISLRIAKVEMALQGHSKRSKTQPTEDSSLATGISNDLFPTPQVRTYLVEFSAIAISRTRQGAISRTQFSVSDVVIVQVREDAKLDVTKLTPLAQELQHRVLVRTDKDEATDDDALIDGAAGRGRNDSTGLVGKKPVLKVELLHDKDQHLDEVEIDIDSILLRVTPTSLKDCAKGLRKVAELVQLVTKEMERKIHEEGRQARLRDKKAMASQHSLSPDVDRNDEPRSEVGGAKAYDSSILFRVTLSETTLLIGRPLLVLDGEMPPGKPRSSHAVVQLVSNALVMFQSVENADGSGSKTLHASFENLAAFANTEFSRISAQALPAMVGPTSAEFRIAYGTENQGAVVSQDISLQCENLASSLTTNDLFIIKSVVENMTRRFQKYGLLNNSGSAALEQAKPRKSFIRYHKKGTSIATTLRVEMQLFSFVLLQAYRLKLGTRTLFSFAMDEVKVNLDGCMTALSGDCSASLRASHFNPNTGKQDNVLEPFGLIVAVDQMPTELVLRLSTSAAVNVNLSSLMLSDFATMDFSMLRKGSADSTPVDGKELATVGLRRAAEGRSITVVNMAGLDIMVSPRISSHQRAQVLVEKGNKVVLSSVSDQLPVTHNDAFREPEGTLSVGLAPSAAEQVGVREPLVNLPITSTRNSSSRLYRLPSPLPAVLGAKGFNPETAETESVQGLSLGGAPYIMEPVVEWCMQNQRLRSSIADVYSLSKGQDILSSTFWSPDDERNDDSEYHAYVESDSAMSELLDGRQEPNNAKSPPRRVKLPTTRAGLRTNWVRPYLKNDSPEWTDMTCILRMARERVMLPDSNWIWLNDWTVDLSGAYGGTTDGDGWEYEADFETFNRRRRFYHRGDACRRRRWTRTRMVKPPRLDDPRQPLTVVWETSRDTNDNFVVTLKSHVCIHNKAGLTLTCLLSSPSWEEVSLGDVESGGKMPVPVRFANATFLRLLAGKDDPKETWSSRRVMIMPSGYSSSSMQRVVLTHQLTETEDCRHVLVHVVSKNGLVDITFEPMIRLVNLLPCQLECEVGEALESSDFRHDDKNRHVVGQKRRRVVARETVSVVSGTEGCIAAVDPSLKPHVSLRVPGYQWSSWHRIVNRKANSHTWQPTDSEADWHVNITEGDTDYAEEFKSIVFFERIGGKGDSLNLILSVEAGHCPRLRVYAQYWILDKTGFGCRFCDGFTDLLTSKPDPETSRRSHLPAREAEVARIKADFALAGYQWSLGMHGMTLYFSRKEKIALCIEGAQVKDPKESQLSSKWITPMDISNVIPKTVFAVDEYNGYRRFELAISVNVCSGIFGRTKVISIFPRYHIVNLLSCNLVIAQDGELGTSTLVPPLGSISYHWPRQSLPPKVRLGHDVDGLEEPLWTNGCIELDKVGITSMRFPGMIEIDSKAMVVQSEVRLATKDQSCAVVVVVWAADKKSNPLYLLRNCTSRTILCRQPLQEDSGAVDEDGNFVAFEGCSGEMQTGEEQSSFECGSEFGPIIKSFLGLDRVEEFVWVLRRGEAACFGFDDPEKHHILEWTCVGSAGRKFGRGGKTAFVEVDAMGTTSTLVLAGGNEVKCLIRAEHSTKVVEFVESNRGGGASLSRALFQQMRPKGTAYQHFLSTSEPNPNPEDGDDDEDVVAFSLTVNLPTIAISVIDNARPSFYGREVLMAQLDQTTIEFSQNREGYHEMELTLNSLQVDNHVHKSIHPVLIFCPRTDENEPQLHMSAVRRLQANSSSFVFRYAAIRLLEIEVFLDRRTAESIASFIKPLGNRTDVEKVDTDNEWVADVTRNMIEVSTRPSASHNEVENIVQTANSGRIYFEQLHLHPVRLGLTFTQEWMDWESAGEGLLLFQFIRGMASIANAPLKFTSFVVGHAFESPQALVRIVATHYSSQLTKQIFGILGSLVILGAPADFISNVGTGVRDFFYEPINGLVHGPAQFLEGLETGTQSLARGVFVGVVRGAANVTEVVNTNLAGLTADDDYIDERKAHQRMLTDAMSRGVANRTITDSLYLAGASVARGVKSGALGILEQPAQYASKYGPVGFVSGVGKALVGAIVKPVVGVGDAAVLVMNHVSDATSVKQVFRRIPKRLRRALPRVSPEQPFIVSLDPYEDAAAKAQMIVTGGESVDDVYIGHVNIPSHLIIASDQCLWAIDRRSREPWCVSWDEISHFGIQDNDKMRITVFSQTGLKSWIFGLGDPIDFANLYNLLAMQVEKMGNGTSNISDLDSSLFNGGLERLSRYRIPGIKAKQVNHVFGSCNKTKKRLGSTIKDEIDVIEQCFARVKRLGSESPSFFVTLDEEAWSLVNSWGQVFSGLSSRRCIAASVINGTDGVIQIKSNKLVEGGSPCYSIQTKEFDAEQGILHPGGAIIFFGWGVVPNLLQAGNVFMNIETNAFVCDLSVHKSRDTHAEALTGYQVGFLEKSYDEAGWWAKYWLLVRKD